MTLREHLAATRDLREQLSRWIADGIALRHLDLERPDVRDDIPFVQGYIACLRELEQLVKKATDDAKTESKPDRRTRS